MSGVIPQSTALAEAGESLSELMSRDPEGFSKRDRTKIVEALREQRQKMALAEAAGGGTKAKTGLAAKAPRSLVSSASAEDLDL